MKIPFKDMWNGQIDAIVEELFVLIVPSSQVSYDEEKEKKAQLESKRAELERVEKSKQLADMKSKKIFFYNLTQLKIININFYNFFIALDQEMVDDSMMEKLIARMIKNIHVEIKRIHVRYEDRVTFKEHPFSVGFTLNSFALESCDNNWSTTGNLKDMYAIQQIFKVIYLFFYLFLPSTILFNFFSSFVQWMV